MANGVSVDTRHPMVSLVALGAGEVSRLFVWEPGKDIGMQPPRHVADASRR